MKLYLSSSGIQSPGALENLIGRPLESCHAAVIPNAKDGLDELDREAKIKDARRMLSEIGVDSKTVDLRDFRRDAALLTALDSVDLIWVMGGDPFRLRHEMRRSGFEVVARKLGDAGIVYAAESAGAIVAGGSLRGFETKSDLAGIPSVIWDGLRLVPNTVLPHVDVTFFSEAVDRVRKVQMASFLIELENSQAAVFDDGVFGVVEAEATSS